MKRIIRTVIIELLTLWLINNYIQGLVFSNGIKTFLLATIALSIANIVIKPIVNVLLLPLNLITFGVFKWLSSAVALYLTTLVIKDFSINYFLYNGFTSSWLDIPKINLNGWLALIAFSFIISFITSIFSWLFK